MNRETLALLSVLLCCVVIISCQQPPAATGGSTLSPSTVAEPAATPEFNACTLFSVADAQQIMGVPMKVAPGSRAPKVCSYIEATQRPNSVGQGYMSLTVNKRGSQGEENRGWADLKEIRHLELGQKNTKALIGIGDEAWWTGDIEKGKIGVAAIIVRKGNSDFMLDSMVMEYIGSPDVLKTMAKRIADQL